MCFVVVCTRSSTSTFVELSWYLWSALGTTPLCTKPCPRQARPLRISESDMTATITHYGVASTKQGSPSILHKNTSLVALYDYALHFASARPPPLICHQGVLVYDGPCLNPWDFLHPSHTSSCYPRLQFFLHLFPPLIIFLLSTSCLLPLLPSTESLFVWDHRNVEWAENYFCVLSALYHFKSTSVVVPLYPQTIILKATCSQDRRAPQEMVILHLFRVGIECGGTGSKYWIHGAIVRKTAPWGH